MKIAFPQGMLGLLVFKVCFEHEYATTQSTAKTISRNQGVKTTFHTAIEKDYNFKYLPTFTLYSEIYHAETYYYY